MPCERGPSLAGIDKKRPCMPDMLPVIGPATRHERLWLNFGHWHPGFTLGPVTRTPDRRADQRRTAGRRSLSLPARPALISRPAHNRPCGEPQPINQSSPASPEPTRLLERHLESGIGHPLVAGSGRGRWIPGRPGFDGRWWPGRRHPCHPSGPPQPKPRRKL